MAQLNVKMPDDRFNALKRLAQRRRTPVSWLIKDYVAYLLAGGEPVVPSYGDTTTSELAALADLSGAFRWLREEPELYSVEDGEPV